MADGLDGVRPISDGFNECAIHPSEGALDLSQQEGPSLETPSSGAVSESIDVKPLPRDALTNARKRDELFSLSGDRPKEPSEGFDIYGPGGEPDCKPRPTLPMM